MPSAAPILEFFFDYGSPFSYLADTQLPALAARTGARVAYRPMLLGGVFKATGNRSPFAEPVEAKRRSMGVDMARWVAHYGVPFRTHPRFPLNTLLLMRHAHAALRAGCFDAFHRAIFPAFWAEARDLDDAAGIAEVVERAGLDARALAAGAETPEVKSALRATTDEAVARGVFGAPSFFVAGELFFGNDRLGLVERALAGARG